MHSVSETDLLDDIASFVSAIGITPIPGGKHTAIASESRWIPTLTAEDINERVQAKRGKRASYKAMLDDVWLIITSDDFASWGTMSEDVANAKYATDFDRVFVLASGIVWELKNCWDTSA